MQGLLFSLLLLVVGGPGAELQIEIFRSKLEAFGIDAFTRNRVGAAYAGVPPPFGGWEVLVRNSDAEEAKAILAEEPPGDDQERANN